jgi:hypothetical protein
MVAAALLVLAALATQTASAAPCKFKYKVQAGDTLIIVADLFQTDWQDIAEASELEEPYVLQVGQVLCIPNGVAPQDTDSGQTSTTSPTGQASLTAEANFLNVAVIVENFPKNHVYYVRVANEAEKVQYPLANVPVFYKIGRLKTDKNGNYAGYFPLPKYFPLTQVLTLCLKDPFTDKTYCTDYDNQFSTMDEHMAFYCRKVGR